MSTSRRRAAALIAGTLTLLFAAALGAGPAAAAAKGAKGSAGPDRPLVIGHRGASGYRPEHTLAAYELAAAHGRRLRRARPRLHQGRRARRPARERDRGHDRRRRPPRVRRPQDDEDDRRRAVDRLVHRGLHARRAQDAAREGAPAGTAPAQHALQRPVRDPDVPGGHRPRAAPVAASSAARSGSTPRPSTRRTSARSGCALEPPLVRTLRRNGLDGADAKAFVQSFETATSSSSTARSTCRSSSCSARSSRPYDLVGSGDRGRTATSPRPPDCAASPDTRTAWARRRTTSSRATALAARWRRRRSSTTRTTRACRSTPTRSATRTSSCRWSCARRQRSGRVRRRVRRVRPVLRPRRRRRVQRQPRHGDRGPRRGGGLSSARVAQPARRSR